MNTHFGKSLSDIPIDKISLKMRVAMKNSVGNYLAGTVCYIKKNTFSNVTISGDPGVKSSFRDGNTDNVVIDWDNGPVGCYRHSAGHCDNIYYIEENK